MPQTEEQETKSSPIHCVIVCAGCRFNEEEQGLSHIGSAQNMC